MTNAQFTDCAQRYMDTVFRVAFNYLRCAADADDATQNVFLKLLKEKRPFESETAVNNRARFP